MAAGEDQRVLRRKAAFALMAATVVAIVAFVALAGNSGSSEAVVLAEDCSVDPWSPACHRPSFMDMLNGLGNRAQSNAIRQKKVKAQLLAQERLMVKKQEEKQAKETSEAVTGNATKSSADTGAKTSLKDTKYNGVDIASKKAIDATMAELLKTGGKAAVEKKVQEIREQVLQDSGKMFGFGKKAGYLPPPPALKKLTGK